MQKIMMVLFLLASTSVFAQPAKGDKGTKCISSFKINRVYDGDTIYVDIHNAPKVLGEDIGVRLTGIDTPEMRGGTPETKAAAKEARDFLASKLIGAKQLRLCSCFRDKFFRINCVIKTKEIEDVGKLMIKSGHAVEYK